MLKKYSKYLFLLIFIAFSVSVYAQNGSISGKIIDLKTGETLPGAIAMVDGTNKGASADLDGNFHIIGLEPGTYKVTIRFISYRVKSIEGIVVTAGKATKVMATMEPSQNDLTEVVVTAKANRESVTALLIEQKNNISMSDGISSESIKKSPDRSSSDILKRISGASIQENRFVIIRGMNDRYNAAFLNDLPLPSTESDRKAFSFDIFPASIIENMVITKTANPESYGDFAGGVIAINTKETPESRMFSIAASTGFNTVTMNQPFQSYKGGKNDFLGIDDGTRALPKDMPSVRDYKTFNNSSPDKALYSQGFNGDWSLKNRKYVPNTGFQLAMGNTYKVFGNDFGAIMALTYNDSYKYAETQLSSYGNNNEFKSEFTDKAYTRNTLAGGIANFTYRVGTQHKFSFKNLYSINSDNKLTERDGRGGLTDEAFTYSHQYNLYFNSNRLYINQLEGSHLFGKAEGDKKVKFNWNLGVSNVKREVPDLRNLTYSVPSDNLNAEGKLNPMSANITSAGDLQRNGRFFSSLNEKLYSAKYDVAVPFDFTSYTKNELKVGGFHQTRSRDFSGRKFGYVTKVRGAKKDSLNLLPIDQIFNTNNIGTNGFLLDEITNPNDIYSASSKLNAGFIMIDSRVAEKLRLTYGLRVENYTQSLTSQTSIFQDTTLIRQQTDYLPSVNITYSLTEKANLRFAYSKTLNRPEFREIAPFTFYDFATNSVTVGNDQLKISHINNYDLRYEYYGMGNQFFAISLFYKKLIDPIEIGFSAVAGGDTRYYSYSNAESATNKGIEFEFRKNFDFVDKLAGTHFFENITLFANTAFIESKVTFITGTTSTTGATRALQGQSPYMFNSGLQYDNRDYGISIGALVNRVGQRIVYVGNINNPDVYENPRTVLDANITKTYKGFEFRVTAGDLLHQNLVFFEDRNKNQKFDANAANGLEKDNVIFSTKTGTTVTFRVGYKF